MHRTSRNLSRVVAKPFWSRTLTAMQETAPHMLPYAGVSPAFATPPVRAGAGSVVLGRVTVGRGGSLGALSVIRADGHFVKVGDDFRLGARSTLHINHEIFPCIIGDRVSVGRNACVHACTVGSDVVIGDDVVILDGAVVEDNVVLEAGSTVFPNKKVPGGFVYAGSPAEAVRPLAVGEVAERRAQLAEVRETEAAAALRGTTAAALDIHPSVFIASTASVRGRLVAAEGSSVWYSNSFDAGEAAISIGARTNIQDNTVIRCTTGQGVSIGHDSTVGHNVMLGDCSIGSGSLIGIGSTVAPGTVVEDRVLLAAAARTTPGQVLESGFMYVGSPARRATRLDAGKHALIDLIVGQYCQYAQDFMAAEREGLSARA
jgi:carbonic anhydrase/acetyltransferase-like protein (isoleucine patch superfamily)